MAPSLDTEGQLRLLEPANLDITEVDFVPMILQHYSAFLRHSEVSSCVVFAASDERVVNIRSALEFYYLKAVEPVLNRIVG